MQVVKNMLTSDPNKGPYMKPFFVLLLLVAVVGCGNLDTSPDEQDQTQAGDPIVNSIGMRFVPIPSGTFTMGETPDDIETPHQVTLTKGFELGVYEVTQAQYEQVMKNNPSNFKGAENPVENMRWDDAVEFCRKLSALPAEKAEGNVYRLPTEAEWEYACRAGTTTQFSFGDDESKLGDYAWYRENSAEKTHPVGSKLSNAWGLYDMHGNVWEWCQDVWHDDYPEGSVKDPRRGTSGSRRVIRGGCWYLPALSCRSPDRDAGHNARSNVWGFRVVRSSEN